MRPHRGTAGAPHRGPKWGCADLDMQVDAPGGGDMSRFMRDQ